MRKYIFTAICLLLSATISFAEEKKEEDKKKTGFAHHAAEIQFTPSTDYLIFRKGDMFIDEPYKGRYPFIGASFGVQYIFRPIRLLGVSTGVQFRMHGSFTRVREYPLFGSPYISQRTNAHQAFVSIPLYIHLYKRMSGCTFEFAIGPDFNIPVFNRSQTTTYLPNGDELSSSSEMNTLTTDAMKKGASFGLSMFLGGELEMGDHGNVFLGPQIQFMDLARFNSDTRKLEQTTGRFYNCALGLKVGFRIH